MSTDLVHGKGTPPKHYIMTRCRMSLTGLWTSRSTRSSPRSSTAPQQAPWPGGGIGGIFASLFPRLCVPGGYTGDGGQQAPAGVVHRGEYVFDKGAHPAASASARWKPSAPAGLPRLCPRWPGGGSEVAPQVDSQDDGGQPVQFAVVPVGSLYRRRKASRSSLTWCGRSRAPSARPSRAKPMATTSGRFRRKSAGRHTWCIASTAPRHHPLAIRLASSGGRCGRRRASASNT